MGQYSIYIEPIIGASYRDGVRDETYVIDKALTPTGFAGTEGIDWENIYELS